MLLAYQKLLLSQVITAEALSVGYTHEVQDAHEVQDTHEVQDAQDVQNTHEVQDTHVVQVDVIRSIGHTSVVAT